MAQDSSAKALHRKRKIPLKKERKKKNTETHSIPVAIIQKKEIFSVLLYNKPQ